MPIHFARIEWLWLIPIVLIWLYWHYRRRAEQGWSNILPQAISQYLLATKSGKTNRHWPWLLGLWLIVSCIALSGPSIQKKNLTAVSGGNARVLVLDMSNSMLATDAKPDRLHIARYKALDLVKQWHGGETGLVAFAGDGFIISPISSDSATLANLIPHLKPSIMPVQGSNMKAGVGKAIQLLKQSGYQSGDIVVIGDSTQSLNEQSIMSELKTQHYRLSFLAVGSPKGSPITQPNGQLLKNRQGDVVISKVQLKNVTPVCQSTGGLCLWVRADNQDVERLTALSNLDYSNKGKQTQSKQLQWADVGYWLIFPLLVLWLFRFRQSSLIALVLLLNIPSPHAQAEDLFKNQAQQANEAFKDKHYQQAATLFKDPNWQASAWYKAGQYQKALDEFKKDNSASGLYNQGNAYAQLGHYKKALAAYKDALAKNPKLQQARDNQQLVQQLLQQQQQQQQQQNNKSSQQSNKSDAHNDKKSGKDSKSDASNQNQQKQGAEKNSKQQDAEHKSSRSKEPDQRDSHNQANSSSANDQNQQQREKEQPTMASGKKSDSKPDSEKPMAYQQSGSAEKQQKQDLDQKQLKQWLNQIPNDPSLLLKNQMQMEYQRQRGQHQATEENW
ncbi:VWA domain-containing protein [Celerinatantimonas sp. MCCC 1A17872]|uniref:vWA domain-containing protein n=1 Tax=Celerinatantimonas sp. MCCC 1A17872 TaxID=3177514 RepID=UPI0038BE593B